MQIITLNKVIPYFFSGKLPTGCKSQVWDSTLYLKKGESVMVKASSGKGKTTFCSIISGYRNDYAGEILIDGKDLKKFSGSDLVRMRRNEISTLFQGLRLFPELNSLENILVKAAIDGSGDVAEITRKLKFLGLDDSMIRRPVSTLSFGQQQRVAFVRMLSCRADFRILDEPVSHLDKYVARDMASMLAESQARDGAAVIVTSVGYDFDYEYTNTVNL